MVPFIPINTSWYTAVNYRSELRSLQLVISSYLHTCSQLISSLNWRKQGRWEYIHQLFSTHVLCRETRLFFANNLYQTLTREIFAPQLLGICFACFNDYRCPVLIRILYNLILRRWAVEARWCFSIIVIKWRKKMPSKNWDWVREGVQHLIQLLIGLQ